MMVDVPSVLIEDDLENSQVDFVVNKKIQSRTGERLGREVLGYRSYKDVGEQRRKLKNQNERLKDIKNFETLFRLDWNISDRRNRRNGPLKFTSWLLIGLSIC